MNEQPEHVQEEPQQAQESIQPITSTAPPRKRRRRLVLDILVGLAVVLLVVCVVAVAWLVVPRLDTAHIPLIGPLLKGKQMLLALPDENDAVELYLLELGQDQSQGILLAEEATTASIFFGVVEEEEYQGGASADYGSFVPGSDRLLFWYDDDETVIHHMRVGDKEPTEIMDSDADWLLAVVFKDPELVFLREPKDGQDQCYIAKPGGKADRLVKADWCTLSLDGSTIIFTEEDKDQTTLSVMDTEGENERVVLDELEANVRFWVSADASHVAYILKEDETYQLHLVERDSGDDTTVGDEVFRIDDFGFVPHSDTLYYLAREEKGDELGLYTSQSDRPLAEGKSFNVKFSPDGKHMAYLVEDEDGEKTLYVHPMEGDKEVEVLDGEWMAYDVVHTSPPRLLAVVAEEDEFSLYSASLDGSNVVELLNEDDANLTSISYVRDEPTLYITMRDEDGEQLLFVTPADEEKGFRLLKGWASIMPLNRSPNGRQLVFWGRKDSDDDPVLYSLALEDGADPVELDDDSESIRNAVFTADGRSVVYTAVTGDEPYDVTVYQVQADGEEKPQELYDEAVLVDVRWDDLRPFVRVSQEVVKEGIAVVSTPTPEVVKEVEVTRVVEEPTEAPKVVTAAPEPVVQPLGSKDNPIIWSFVPMGEMQRTLASAESVAGMIQAQTGLVIEMNAATEYAQVTEAMCNHPVQAHMGSMAVFAYVQAAQRGCAEAALISVRFGSATYNGQIIARADSGITHLSDLVGKTFCRPDPLSTSGWIVPSLELRAAGVNPDVDLAQIVDTGSHNAVVAAVYNGDCDAGSTYVDARVAIEDDYPDVKQVIAVINTSVDIPNDGLQFAPSVPQAIRAQIVGALLNIAETDDGLEALDTAFYWGELQEIDDSFYDPFRQLLYASGVGIEKEPVVAVTPTPTGPPHRVYVIGTNAEWPPFESIDETGNIVGFDADIMAAIAEAAGFEFEFVHTRWDGIFVALQSGEFDAVISGATITDERSEIVDFSEPYFNGGPVIVVRTADADRIATAADLDGKKVGVQLGTFDDVWVSDNTDAEAVRFETIAAAFQALADGHLDAVVYYRPGAIEAIKADPELDLTVVGEPLTDEWYGIAVNKSRTELLALINLGLAIIRADGTYDHIHDQWFGLSEAGAAVTVTPSPVKEPVKLTIFGYAASTAPEQIQLHEQIAQEFNDTHTNIQIEFLTVPYSEREVWFATMVAAGDPPDLCMPININEVAIFYEQWLDISPYIEAEGYDLRDFFEPAVALHTYPDKMVGLPMNLFPSVIYYNQDLFDAAGLDYPPHDFGDPNWTYDELVELAKELTLDANGNDANSSDFDWQDTVQWGWNGLSWAGFREYPIKFGGSATGVSEDHKTAEMNSPEWVAAAQWMADNIWTRHIRPTNDQANNALLGVSSDPFNSGMVAMWECHTWMSFAWDDWTDAFNWDMAAVPAGPKGDIVAAIHGTTFAIPSSSRYPDQAWQVAKWMLQPEIMDRLVESWGGVPARKSLAAEWAEDMAAQHPDADLNVVLESIYYLDAPNRESWVPEWTEVNNAITDAANLIIRGENLNVQQVMDALNEKVQSYLDDYWADH